MSVAEGPSWTRVPAKTEGEGAYEWEVTDNHGSKVVRADTVEEAERKARYEVWDCGWGSDPVGVIDRGEAGHVQNITLYPHEGFCPQCGRGEPHHDPGCRAAH